MPLKGLAPGYCCVFSLSLKSELFLLSPLSKLICLFLSVTIMLGRNLQKCLADDLKRAPPMHCGRERERENGGGE